MFRDPQVVGFDGQGEQGHDGDCPRQQVDENPDGHDEQQDYGGEFEELIYSI